MKTLLKLILATIIIAFNFSISCSDNQQPQQLSANGQSNEIVQEDTKKKAELSKETLEYWQLRVAKSAFSAREPDNNPYSPHNLGMILHCACSDNNLPVLEDLFRVFTYEQLDPGSKKFCEHPYPSKAVECLLLNKANPNAIIPHNRSPLVPEWNKKNGIRTSGNLTPLMIHTKFHRGSNKSVVLLLQHKADIHAKDAQGESVLTSLTFKYEPSINISNTCSINEDVLKALLNGGIDLEYVNPQLQETNPNIRKQLLGQSDYERLSVDPKARQIMDGHRLHIARVCHQAIKSMEESTELPIPLKRIIGDYLMSYPLIHKFALSQQEICAENIKDTDKNDQMEKS